MSLPQPPDRWDIELLTEERTAAVGGFGFTPRQARFLVEVLIHTGVFVERQYCSFAGIVHGQKSTDFLKTLVERRFATPISTGKPGKLRFCVINSRICSKTGCRWNATIIFPGPAPVQKASGRCRGQPHGVTVMMS